MVDITTFDRLDTLSAVGGVNNNFSQLKAAVEELQSDKLSNDLDANSKRIYNLADGVLEHEPATVGQLSSVSVDPVELTQLYALVASLQTLVSNLGTTVGGLTSQLATALARIAELEAIIGGGIVPTPDLPTGSFYDASNGNVWYNPSTGSIWTDS